MYTKRQMDDIITSASNPTIKYLRRLAGSSKARREENMYIAEGIHLVGSCLVAGVEPSMYILAQSAVANAEIELLMGQLDAAGVRRVTVADSLFESVASVHAEVGIATLFAPRNNSLDGTESLGDSAVLLDDVQDPGNIGTILRTAAAVGTRKVLLSPGSSSAWSPKAMRAGMGAQFGLEIYENVDLAVAVVGARVPVLATALTADASSLYDVDLNRPVAWVFGSEGGGVSVALQKQADQCITIPQASGSVESLNVSAAAAVCLYESYRQNQQQVPA